MKQLTCQDLGGPCEVVFTGETFEEIGKKSHDHVIDQINKGDEEHIAAANRMREASPEEQQAMMAEFARRFVEAEEV